MCVHVSTVSVCKSVLVQREWTLIQFVLVSGVKWWEVSQPGRVCVSVFVCVCTRVFKGVQEDVRVHARGCMWRKHCLSCSYCCESAICAVWLSMLSSIVNNNQRTHHTSNNKGHDYCKTG